jgi:hypothetical protein
VFLAAVSSGMPIWPGAMLVNYTPVELLSAELRTVSDTR